MRLPRSNRYASWFFKTCDEPAGISIYSDKRVSIRCGSSERLQINNAIDLMTVAQGTKHVEPVCLLTTLH